MGSPTGQDHELAHVRLHGPGSGTPLAVREIAKPSRSPSSCVARVGLATDAYSFGYLATWATGDTDAIRATGERVIVTARRVLDALGLDHSPEQPD